MVSIASLVVKATGKFIYRETIEVEARTEEAKLLMQRRREQLQGTTGMQDVRLGYGEKGDEARRRSSCETRAMRR